MKGGLIKKENDDKIFPTIQSGVNYIPKAAVKKYWPKLLRQLNGVKEIIPIGDIKNP